MLAPASYTREDVVEAHVPGAPAVVEATLHAMLQAGARPAQPGEFTRRALLNGRIDLAQAEAVQRIIRARGEREARAALRALNGDLSRAARGLRERVAALCAEIEAALDFADQDIEIIAGAEAARRARALAEEARRAAHAPRGRVHDSAPRVALRGPVNAGKSTLFNTLLAADRAIVSPHPGATRDTIEAEADLGDFRALLVDTAGLRPPAGAIEAEANDRADRAGREADLVIFVLDSSAALKPDALNAFGEIQPERRILVMNKADLPMRQRMAPDVRVGDVFEVSALTGSGVDALRLEIGTRLKDRLDRPETAIALNARHADALARAAEALCRAARTAREETTFDLAAADLRDALDAVGEIAGHVPTEGLLDRIFNEFCIGK